MGDSESSESMAEKEIPQGSPGETCDTKRLKRVYEGDSFVVKDDATDSRKSTDKYHIYALTSTQNYDHKNKPTTKTLRINSQHILKGLDDVVQYYPSHCVGFDQPVEIESPFEILYHHEHELAERREATDDPTAKAHFCLLLNYLKEEPGAGAAGLISAGLITFNLLWAIFKPGDLVYTIENGHKRLYWLRSTSYSESWSKGEYLELKCSYHAFDGTQAGRATRELSIYQNLECPGNSTVRITSLSILPLKHYPNWKKIETELGQRGKKYLELTNRCVHKYEGLCMRLKLPPGSQYYNEEESFNGVWLPQTASGRVVIDCKTFMEDHNQHKTKIHPWIYSENELVDGPKNPLILCPPYVYGYYLNMRCWCQLFVKNIKPVCWDPAALSSVIMDDPQKETLQSLVQRHRFATTTRDETELKGKGLVIVLHGPPGTGKTCTAETIAESTQKPLLLFPTGELGSQLSDIQTELSRLVRYATAWQAVLLIDEADVFLESRESGGQTSLERNALVAVFLRQLEYFQGIIFLTSNRAQMFDPAVRSRIHIMLHYPSPNRHIRRQLWEQKLKPHIGESQKDLEATLHVVSQYEMNGREISNTVTSAKTIASQKLKAMSLEHLQTVLQVWKDSQLVASKPAPSKSRILFTKISPWLRRIVGFVLFCGALRLSFVGIKKLKNMLLGLRRGSK